MRPYETRKLAALRRASNASVWFGFACFALAIAINLIASAGEQEQLIVAFFAAGFAGTALWFLYCLLVFPKWCRYWWLRLLALRSGT